MQMPKLKGLIRAALTCALVMSLCALPERSPGATPSKGVVAAPKPAARPSSSRHVPANPHLHNRSDKNKASMARRKTTQVHSTIRRVNYPRHVYAYHLYGTISGFVSANSGGAISGASVRLAKPGGRRIKNPHARHGTSTNGSGTFSMHMVKAGRYRVVASRSGAGKGHTPVAIHSTGIHRVDIKLGGAKPKKTKRHK